MNHIKYPNFTENDNLPGISVILSTYNNSQYLSTAIKSILNQTYKNFEFIIINDGSTDDTEDVVFSFNDKRISYYKTNNKGLGKSLNYGIKISQHQIIARMDDDDIALPTRFEKQILFMLKNPKYDIISSWYAVFEENKIVYVVKTPTEHKKIISDLALYSQIIHPGSFIKKDVFENNQYNSIFFEDYDLWLRLMKSKLFYNIPEILTMYRYRKNSLSRESYSEKLKVHYDIQAYYYKDFERNFPYIAAEHSQKYFGWREYFYGSKKKARYYWNKYLSNYFDIKVIIAYCLTFLPSSFLIVFKEMRVRYRIEYLYYYFKNKDYLDNLNDFIKHISLP